MAKINFRIFGFILFGVSIVFMGVSLGNEEGTTPTPVEQSLTTTVPPSNPPSSQPSNPSSNPSSDSPSSQPSNPSSDSPSSTTITGKFTDQQLEMFKKIISFPYQKKNRHPNMPNLNEIFGTEDKKIQKQLIHCILRIIFMIKKPKIKEQELTKNKKFKEIVENMTELLQGELKRSQTSDDLLMQIITTFREIYFGDKNKNRNLAIRNLRRLENHLRIAIRWDETRENSEFQSALSSISKEDEKQKIHGFMYFLTKICDLADLKKHVQSKQLQKYEEGQSDLVLLKIVVRSLDILFNRLYNDEKKYVVNERLESLFVKLLGIRNISTTYDPVVRILKASFNKERAKKFHKKLVALADTLKGNPQKEYEVNDEKLQVDASELTNFPNLFSSTPTTTGVVDKLPNEILVDAFRVVRWILVHKNSNDEKNLARSQKFFSDYIKGKNETKYKNELLLFKLIETLLKNRPSRRNPTSEEQDIMRCILSLFERTKHAKELDGNYINRIIRIFDAFFTYKNLEDIQDVINRMKHEVNKEEEDEDEDEDEDEEDEEDEDEDEEEEDEEEEDKKEGEKDVGEEEEEDKTYENDVDEED